MNEERIEEIKERAARAAEGPWRLGDYRGVGEDYDIERAGGEPLDGVFRGMFRRKADAEFAASAREDIPALVEALEEAQKREKQTAREYRGWLELVPEPWSSVLRTEIHSRALKARRILDAAAADEESYRSAREKVRELGLDPDGVPRFDPDE